MQPVYKRVLIKISGEALSVSKGMGFDFAFVSEVCKKVKECTQLGSQVAIVIGGGNFWRGVKDGAGKVERVSADKMGMLATAMNCLAVADVFKQCGAEARILTAVDIQGVGERHDAKKAVEYLENGKYGAGWYTGAIALRQKYQKHRVQSSQQSSVLSRTRRSSLHHKHFQHSVCCPSFREARKRSKYQDRYPRYSCSSLHQVSGRT